MFAKLKQHPKYDGVVEVVAPFRPITYDIVSSPSHNSARILKLFTESVNINHWLNSSNESDLSFVNESEDISHVLESDNIGKVKSSSNDFREYMEDVIKRTYSHIRSVNFNF